MPQSVVHGHLLQSASQLESLVHSNVPSNALAESIFLQLQRKGMSASDLKDQLSPEGGYGDYDHFSDFVGWQAVQAYIGEYLRSGHNYADLAGQLFEILDFDFRKTLERLANQVMVSQPRRRSPSSTAL